MSSWKQLGLPTVPGIPTVLDATEQAAGTLSSLLDGLSDVMATLSEIASLLTDPVNAAMTPLLATIQGLADEIDQVLNAGIHFYLDKGPYFVGAAPDGLVGFLSRWEASFEDPGDSHRPQYAEGQSVSAMLIIVAAANASDLVAPLDLLGSAFGVPTMRLDEQTAGTEDLPEAVENAMSTPPDWQSKSAGEVLPPIAGLTEVLERAAGTLAVPASYAEMLEGLAEVLSDKAVALATLADEIQAVADMLDALADAEGLHVLSADGNGVADLVETVKNSDNPPALGDHAWVSGVCLLAPTEVFAPVAALLGGE